MSTRRRSSVMAAVLAAAWFGAGPARAGLLNPLDPAFPSLGTLSATSGSYTFNTGTGGALPTLTGPGGLNLTGTVFNGVAVFDFSAITIGVNPTVVGDRPLALLSRDGVTISGLLDVSAPFYNATVQPGSGAFQPPGPGGFGGGPPTSSGFNTNGLGPGGGGGGTSTSGGGGGGFGGNGGNAAGGSLGGKAYGDLSQTLQGGSGGGGGGSGNNPFGGGGGGAVEIGAVNAITVSGSIRANGDPGELGTVFGGGGGSGGGILLHGSTVSLLGVTPGSVLQAYGGAGGGGGTGSASGGGGGGGGGRVQIYTDTGLLAAGSVDLFDVHGGPGGSTGGSPGAAGAILIGPVPEPSGLILTGLGAVTLLGYLRLRRGPRPRRSPPAHDPGPGAG